MKTPSIHINGTSRDDLLDALTDAVRDLRNALSAMATACPNARDYYPQGDGAYAEARREHEERVALVRSVLRDYQSMLESVESVPARRAGR